MSVALIVRKPSRMTDIDVPRQYATPSFIAVRNEWYRRLEREGMEVDEDGFRSARERKRKGAAQGDPLRYEFGADGAPDEAAERVNARTFGGPRVVWNLDNAEYWQLMSEQVELLPWTYFGKPFLRRWAEIGDVRTAAEELGISRWRGRQIHERFMTLLKRKRVLR